jgi:hypothetical protein
VQFTGLGERIELVHRATNRDIFARGALFAARQLQGRRRAATGCGTCCSKAGRRPLQSLNPGRREASGYHRGPHTPPD